MQRNLQKIGVLNWLLLLAAGAVGLGLARYSRTVTGEAASFFLLIGFLAAAVSYFQMRLEDRERMEKLEFDELNKAPAGSALFQSEESEILPARRSREQFERFFVPGFTIFLFLLEGALLFFLWRSLRHYETAGIRQPMVALSIFGLFGLVLFLFGKYSAGIARLEGLRLLRPGAGYLLLGAFLCFGEAVILIAVEAGFPLADLYAAWVLTVLLALLAVETLLTLVLEIYRPRLKGKPGRVLYESRVVGLLGQPEGLITTAAQALDYQFGFKVSETWFYRFLEKALAWLLLAQLFVLLLSSCFVFVQTGEEALLERFGQPVPGHEILRPGFHLKLPWPIDKIYTYRTEKVQSFTIGIGPEDTETEERVIRWTVAHYQNEYNLLVASREQSSTNATNTATNNATGRKVPPVNLLSVSIPVQYQITNLNAWAYNQREPGKLLEKLATREVVRFLVSADVQELMSTGRAAAAEALKTKIQSAANNKGLGARILFVGLQGIHPPVKVAAAYEKVVSARQDKEASILQARAHQIETNALARAAAFRRVSLAQAEKAQTEADAAARAASFTNQIPAFRASPLVYTERAYLQTLAQSTTNAAKVVLGTTNNSDVFILDLEESSRRGLFEGLTPVSNP